MKMHIRRALLALLITCGLPCAAQAEVKAFAGEGSRLLPLSSVEVRMLDEHVVFEGIPTDGELSSWKVTSTSHIKNETNAPLDIQVGFPFPDMTDLQGVILAAPPNQDPSPSLIYDFQATVNGQPVTPKELQLKRSEQTGNSKSFAYVWAWNVHFEPGGTAEIRIDYTTGVTKDFEGRFYASYGLRAGANWKGSQIGQTKIEIRPHMRIKLCSDAIVPAMLKGEIIEPSSPSKPAYRNDLNGHQLAWTLKNESPRSDLNVCFFTAQSYLNHLERWQPLWTANEFELSGMTNDELQMHRNLYFAVHGNIFRTPKIKAYFSNQWWYQEDPTYSVSRLSKGELEMIKKIKGIEENRKLKRAHVNAQARKQILPLLNKTH